jgi:putative component of membrane protein insertase Oxa1/YidC/SpoIIIJ protein YidD
MSVKFKRNIIVLFTIFISITTMNSCKKKCNCSENYDATRLYDKGDLVIYNGKCWKASSRGRGITPGPWLQDGNDIWKECIEQ